MKTKQQKIAFIENFKDGRKLITLINKNSI